MRTTDAPFDINVWAQLKYPVTLAIKRNGVWETVFIAENSADLEFRLSEHNERRFTMLLCPVSGYALCYSSYSQSP